MAKKKRKAKIVKLQPKLSLSKYIKKFGRTLEIHEVLWMETLLDIGKGTISVARKKRNGDVIFATFLIDTYCLGVKDTFFQLVPNYEYEEFRAHFVGLSVDPIVEVEANYAFNIIYGAVEYAEDLGIEPHKIFSVTEYLLPLPEELEYVDIEFGLDGKPCYDYHPGDRKADILNKLTKAVGPDGFTFIDEQFFEDDLGGEFSYDYKNDFIQAAEERYDNESEKSAYLFFASIVKYWDDDFGDYFEDLEGMFNYNKHKVCRLIKDEFGDTYDFESGEITDEYLLGITEKYLIYGSTNFLYDDEYFDTFNVSNKELEVAVMIGSINLSKYGDEKIKELLNMFFMITKEARKGKSIDEYLVELNNNLEDDNFKPEYSELLILNLINDHMDYYGPIDFSKFDFKI